MIAVPNIQWLEDKISAFNNHLVMALNYSKKSEIILVKFLSKNVNNQNAKFTISMPICNQEKIIKDVLRSLFCNISEPSDLVFVIDACKDNSESVLIKFIRENFDYFSLIMSVTIVRSRVDLFEATCDKFALSITRTQYFMSIQSDIYLNDKSFQQRATRAFELFPEVSGISGKAVLPFRDPRIMPLKQSYSRFFLNIKTKLLGKGSLRLGFFGSSDIYFGDVSVMPKMRMKFSKRELNRVYLGDAIIRGPAIWRTSSLIEIGGINDIAYFLGWDDYDLSWRLWHKLGLRVGYLPCASYSIPNSGTNSKLRLVEAEIQYKLRDKLSKMNHGELATLWENLNNHSRDTLPRYEILSLK